MVSIGDGARWIRNVWKQCFPEAAYILDWYHLDRKLYEALKLTLPAAESLELYRKVSRYLWRGLRDTALEELKSLFYQLLSEGKQDLLSQSCGLGALIEYIVSNWVGLVDYHSMYKAGYLIASSLVEKAADLVVAKRQKKKQSMQWTIKGADNLSALRTLWLNDDWEEYWRERRVKAA